ncbi:MAG: SIMPL domain-containing protein [Cyclobacteriaceae bacterium]
MNTIKTLVVMTLLITSYLTQAQTKTIEVGGSAEMKVAPDQSVLHINISAHKMEFGQAVEALSKKESKILKKIESLGYNSKKVKTQNFSVRENTIWRNGTRYDSGYIASQSMKLEFTNTTQRIAKILNTFSEGKTDAQISFSFKLSDELEDKMTEQLIEMAVKDAKTKAGLLAKYSEVTIKSVAKIIYNTPQGNSAPVYGRMEMAMSDGLMSKSSGSSNGFQADDITLTDQVMIIYEIE